MPSGQPADADPELTIDQLAAEVSMTVRNVRAYAARGLLPPPRIVGRTGYYGRQHVARLVLVREMLAEGYSLSMIERTLANAPATASGTTLALHRALLAPWLPAEPEEMSVEELATRAGPAAGDLELISQLVELGLVEQLPDGRLRVLDPTLLSAGLEVVQLGIPPRELIAAQAQVTELVRSIAETYVGMFRDTVWRAFVEAGAPPERFDEIRSTMARLPPAAAQAVLASFRTEMSAAVAHGLQTELSGLEPEGQPDGDGAQR